MASAMSDDELNSLLASWAGETGDPELQRLMGELDTLEGDQTGQTSQPSQISQIAPTGVFGFKKTKICMYWQSGTCTKGESCTFAHGEAELGSLQHGGSSPAGKGAGGNAMGECRWCLAGECWKHMPVQGGKGGGGILAMFKGKGGGEGEGGGQAVSKGQGVQLRPDCRWCVDQPCWKHRKELNGNSVGKGVTISPPSRITPRSEPYSGGKGTGTQTISPIYPKGNSILPGRKGSKSGDDSYDGGDSNSDDAFGELGSWDSWGGESWGGYGKSDGGYGKSGGYGKTDGGYGKSGGYGKANGKGKAEEVEPEILGEYVGVVKSVGAKFGFLVCEMLEGDVFVLADEMGIHKKGETVSFTAFTDEQGGTSAMNLQATS